MKLFEKPTVEFFSKNARGPSVCLGRLFFFLTLPCLLGFIESADCLRLGHRRLMIPPVSPLEGGPPTGRDQNSDHQRPPRLPPGRPRPWSRRWKTPGSDGQTFRPCRPRTTLCNACLEEDEFVPPPSASLEFLQNSSRKQNVKETYFQQSHGLNVRNGAKRYCSVLNRQGLGWASQRIQRYPVEKRHVTKAKVRLDGDSVSHPRPTSSEVSSKTVGGCGPGRFKGRTTRALFSRNTSQRPVPLALQINDCQPVLYYWPHILMRTGYRFKLLVAPDHHPAY